MGGHDLKYVLEILTLHRKELRKGGFPLLKGPCHDHVNDDRETFAGIEHALRSAQSDSFCPITDRDGGHFRGIAIRHNTQSSLFIRPT